MWTMADIWAEYSNLGFETWCLTLCSTVFQYLLTFKFSVERTAIMLLNFLLYAIYSFYPAGINTLYSSVYWCLKYDMMLWSSSSGFLCLLFYVFLFFLKRNFCSMILLKIWCVLVTLDYYEETA